MVRNGNGTKWLWYEMAMVRNVMVRNGNDTKWLWYEMTAILTIRWACANILTPKTGTGLYLFRISPASAMNDDVHVL